MALPDPTPIPPELADPEPPIPDSELEVLWDEAVDLAADAALDVVDAVQRLADSEDGPNRRWHITDLGGAEWCMRHVAECTAELTQLEDQAQQWAERINEWFDQAAARVKARRAFFDQHLQLYAMEERERTGGKVKSISLPSGRVQTRSAEPKVTVARDQDVLDWARQRGLLDEIAPPKRDVKLTPLREHAQVVEVIDQARLVLSDGQVFDWVREGFDHEAHGHPVTMAVCVGVACPAVGDGYYLVEHSEPDMADVAVDLDALVGRVEVLCSHPEVQDENGVEVPGCAIDSGGVTATVQPDL